jgi:hypothetical protein
MKAPAGAGMRGLPLLHSRAGRILLILFVIRLSLVALTIAEPHGALFTDSLEYLALSNRFIGGDSSAQEPSVRCSFY